MIVRRPAAAAPRRRRPRRGNSADAGCCCRWRSRRSCSPLQSASCSRARRRRGASEAGSGGQHPSAARSGVVQPAAGDGEEHDERVADATDGDPATYWTTETYEAFTKPASGSCWTRAHPAPERIELTSDTPGLPPRSAPATRARARSRRWAPSSEAGAETTWELDGDEARYYVVWITAFEGVAHVNEVSGR